MLVGILKGIAKEFYVAVVVPCNRSMLTNSERFRSVQGEHLPWVIRPA